MDNTGEEDGRWGVKNIVQPIQAPRDERFSNNYQYFQFNSPPTMLREEQSSKGFYNHAYAPIGTPNALYTPMPGNMFQQTQFDYILTPTETKPINIFDYMNKYTPEKTYMALPYFQALFDGSLPCSYKDARQLGDPQKKIKTELQPPEM